MKPIVSPQKRRLRSLLMEIYRQVLNNELQDCQFLSTLRSYGSSGPIYQIPFLQITFTLSQ